MKKMLEIREGCKTPKQLIKSLPFSKFLQLYKKEFIEHLIGRDDRHHREIKHKVEFIKGICARHFLEILETEDFTCPKELQYARDYVRFADGAFHHYRNMAYIRLVRLYNAVVTDGSETPESIRDRVTAKSKNLSDLILKTRRKLMGNVDLVHHVRRTYGIDASPNVTAGEISGHYFNLPVDYLPLSHVPLTIAADIRTGIDYNTPANKRVKPFYALDHNPIDLNSFNSFNSQEWVAVPFQVGSFLIVAYLHKSHGKIEMEPGLLNLFPFASIESLKQNRRPDGIFFFGDPNARDEDLGFYRDKKNKVVIGMVPGRDELMYFGYAKKPILTMHNVLAIYSGEVPLHCGCTRYLVRFDDKTKAPYIADMRIKADDMGRISLQKTNGNIIRPIFYGTETGAFACLDGFSENAKMKMIGREVGYNKDVSSNARQIIPVSMEQDVINGDPLDVLLYVDNFTLLEKDECTIKDDMTVTEAIGHFRRGERVAAGSTQTYRGEKESSYWANPFPLLKDESDKIIHPELYKRFIDTEVRLTTAIEALVARGEMKIGIAYSQLMAGVYKDNSDEDIKRCSYTSREQIESCGPTRLAESLVDCIKKRAVEKAKGLKENHEEISVTVALVGDSRTGKSETAEKIEAVLGLELV